jgi:hypothetical protein
MNTSTTDRVEPISRNYYMPAHLRSQAKAEKVHQVVTAPDQPHTMRDALDIDDNKARCDACFFVGVNCGQEES